MSVNSVAEVAALGVAPLLSFEVVITDDDFFVSVNGDCLPSMCDGFSLNETGCFVLRQGPVEFVSAPMSPQFVSLFSTNNVLFAQFLPNKEIDISFLPHLGFIEGNNREYD